MERGPRIALIGAALVVAAIAVILTQPDDSDDDAERTPASSPTLQGEPTASVPAPKPKPEPFDRIRIADGSVPGGERRITVSKGDVTRIEVRSDAPDEIHLHGYDVTKPVGPDKPARFRIDADIEGVFEIEAHDLGQVVVGTLIVEP